MKTLLIVFAVLLFLLTLLSSFGGSIRSTEPFYDPVPAVRKEEYTRPNPPSYDTFQDNIALPPAEVAVPPPRVADVLPSIEKLEVPEPFVNMEDNMGAPY